MLIMHRRILLARDGLGTWQTIRQTLETEKDIHVDLVASSKEAIRALTEQGYSIFLSDLESPQFDGLRLIEDIHQRNIPVTVIVLAGQGSIDDAVQAMRL